MFCLSLVYFILKTYFRSNAFNLIAYRGAYAKEESLKAFVEEQFSTPKSEAALGEQQ